MKPKVRFLTLILALVASALSSFAGDQPTTFHYEAEVAGVMCSACSKKVQTAMEKLEGVSKVKVKASKEPNVALVEITSTSTTLNKEAAIQALGTDASSYNVRSLTKKE
ncbi:MAG: heavy-metal-associated domain-containing protein [Verrucomicrobiales bacterium]|nr:heavy-metal-associated domain-containing protein [Verrucomicrobiales bacterium]MCP5559695.1 heavy-metal-associated domain-containing protein [Verrucomicrobiaceae bacterium]